MDSIATAALNDTDELEPRSETRRASEIPTVPAPRQTTESTGRILMAAYRQESARLIRIAAQLKEMGIDVQAAWSPDAV